MSKNFTEALLKEFVLGLFTDVRDVLYETAVRVKDQLAKPGDPITYPVQWDSPKQRAAFFASNGFGGGIPYVRTQKHELSWTVQRVALGSNVSAPHPAGAISGIPSGWQSRIHRGRWVYTLNVLFTELSKIPQEINNKFSVRGQQ